MTSEELEPAFLDYVAPVLETLGPDVSALVAVGLDGRPLALWSWPSAATAHTLDGLTCKELAGAVDDVDAFGAHLVVVSTDATEGREAASLAVELLGEYVSIEGTWSMVEGHCSKLGAGAPETPMVDDPTLKSTRFEALIEWRQAINCASQRSHLDPAVLARLWSALADALCRDAMIVDLIPGQGRVAEALCQDGHAAGLREGLARIFGPDETIPAPRTVLLAAIHVAELVHGARPSAHALGVAALAWWWLDDSLHALEATERARALDPRHRLSALVEAAVLVGMRPGWRTEAA